MKFPLIIFFAIPLTVFAQTVLTGKVVVCEECRGVAMTVKDDKTGKVSYSVKTSRSNRRQLTTETMIAGYKLIKDGRVVDSGTTEPTGTFKIRNLHKGIWDIQIFIHPLLKADTSIQINRKRAKIKITLHDKGLWKYIDSTELAKFPYNQNIARQDIKEGEIKLLSYGLQALSGNELDSVTAKYGFKYVQVAGCVVSGYERKAIEDYNSVVDAYLQERNGNNWKEKLRSDIAGLYQRLREKKER